MNRQSYSQEHTVYLVDMEETFLGLLTVIADYCDGEMFSQQDILMLALNLLCVSYTVDEASEALEIEINTYCQYQRTPYAVTRIRSAIKHYLDAVHREFHHLNFYGEDAHLQYTFGGWHGDYTPKFVPYTHVRQYKDAISAIVHSEPIDPHPSRVFRSSSSEQTDHLVPF